MTINISSNPNYQILTKSDLYVGISNYGTTLAGAGTATVSASITSYNSSSGNVTVSVSCKAGKNAYGTVFIVS